MLLRYAWKLFGVQKTTMTALLVTPVVLYSIGLFGQDRLKNGMYKAGFLISQKFKSVPLWDRYVEPALVRNFATIVIAGNALLEGMVSDNESDSVKDMEQMRQDIKKGLDEYEHAEHGKQIKKVTRQLSRDIQRFLELEQKVLDNSCDI